jgi:hypothetical protein
MRTAKKQRPAHSPELTVFCRQVRKRSLENRQALGVLHRNTLTGNVIRFCGRSLIRWCAVLSCSPYRTDAIEID